MRESLANKMKDAPRALMAAAAAAVLACALSLAGCAQQPANSSSDGSDAPSSSSAAEEQSPEMTISVSLREDVTKSTDVDTPLQFAEEHMSVVAPTGATALEVLESMGREVQTSGEGDAVEVTAIGGLENGAAGEGSHWIYEVNGETGAESPAVCTLSDGDRVQWLFVAS